MADPQITPFKLPVRRSVGLAVRWTVAIVLRHWMVVVLFAVTVGVVQWALTPSQVVGQPVNPGGWFLLVNLLVLVAYAVASVVLAMLTHNEVLRGPSGLDAATLGRGPGRGFGYVLDAILVSLIPAIGLMLLIAVVSAVAWIVAGGAGTQGVAALTTVGMLVGVLGFAGVVNRLMLRLPSRALGHPDRWGDIWRMGRGNTWRLLGANLLLWLLLVVPVLLVSLPFIATLLTWTPKLGEAMPEPPLLLTLVGGAIIPVEIILFCAFLSVAYGQLRAASAPDITPSAGRIEPGF
ncbi:hypothetical protein ACI7BZ_05600 [Xanthobacter sp. AM11]|uniref:hypothetical protein n=1 Tax=Xanthobacter sp. AM11 TaxID=3380643 RepID=UPI0039BF9A1E